MQQSIQSFNISIWATHIHLIVLHAWTVGWKIGTLPGWGGEFEPKVSSLSRGTHILSFNMEVLKEKEFTFTSRWRRKGGGGLQGLSFRFHQIIDHQIWHLGKDI